MRPTLATYLRFGGRRPDPGASSGLTVRARGDLAGAHDVLKEALAVAQYVGDPSRIGEILTELGRTECEARHYDVAVKYFKRGITIFHELVIQLSTFHAA